MIATANGFELATEKMREFALAYTEKFSISLMGGLSGIALSAAHVGRHLDPSYQQLSETMLTEIVNRLNEGKLRTSSLHTFCSGLAGVMYTLDHLEAEGLAPAYLPETTYATLVDVLMKECRKDFAKRNTDYLHGPLGVFLTFLKRWPNPVVEPAMDEIIDTYVAQLVTDDRGSRIYNSVIMEQHPEEYSFGLAHGLAGHQLIFAEALRRGYRPALMRTLLQDIGRYMESYRRPENPEEQWQVFYPTFVVENDPEHWEKERPGAYVSRVGWCYGDINVALAQLKVGKVIGDEEQYARGRRLSDHLATRLDPANAQINVNPYFCHGAIGTSYMFAAIARETGSAACGHAHRHWLDHAETLMHTPEHTTEPVTRTLSMLEGLPGVSLGMLGSLPEANLPASDFFLLNL
ncbi:lanthionine synthetase LanC family protein [Lewinella sp. W8]|uniref:lanthionine synthetase LanC family protein n=1 Tax=Lewinella sp. W8 TaxID=2528208 RepID=UPI001067B011|nr:lanthionine synthetase LanC family protein [Lewinella sp. W8]MTB50731.1 hypothetical protein [Lewinella sp. W8]